MTVRRSDLIVPIRDRRQHRRILTLKNFGIALAVIVAAFAGITIEANLRHAPKGSEFGRLYGRQLPPESATELKTPEIITEAPVPEQTAADPMLVGAAAREQLLRANSNVAAPSAPEETPQPVVQASTAAVPGESRVAIVGGTEGVAIVKESARPPMLRGGFGRQ